MFRKKEITILLFLFLFGFLVRLYRFNNPIADWQSWRQADTGAVARNYVKNGIDLLHPRMNNISNVQSGLENPKGYFYAEFPIYDATQAGLFILFGRLTIEEWGRLISIFTSLAGWIFLFLLVRRRGYTLASWFILLFGFFVPYNIYYGRVILPDPSMVGMLLGGIYFFDVWLDKFREKKKKKYYVFFFLAIIFTALSLLLKPFALFYGLTFFALAYSVFKWKVFFKWQLWIFLIFAILPLILWRKYITMYPEGIPANSWLFNSNHIRFHPAFFRWIFYERLTKLMSGFFNVIFVATGLVGVWKTKDRWFFFSIILSALAYICVIATGNVQHDYYQIVAMPAVILMMSFGAAWAIQILKKNMPSTVAYCLVGSIVVCGLFFGWQQIKDYFDIDNPAIIEAGQAVDRLTPPNAKVLAPYGGDSAFLYQTKRQGWASFEHDLPTLIKMGADYIVLVHPTAQDLSLGKQYKIIAQTPNYIIVNLQQKP